MCARAGSAARLHNTEDGSGGGADAGAEQPLTSRSNSIAVVELAAAKMGVGVSFGVSAEPDTGGGEQDLACRVGRGRVAYVNAAGSA